MKLKFASGNCLSLWESEYTDVDVSIEGVIRCVRPSGKVAIIRVPKQWLQTNGSEDGTKQARSFQVRAPSNGLHYVEELITRNDSKMVPVGPSASPEVEIKSLARNIESLKLDLDRFKADTSDQLKSVVNQVLKVRAEFEEETIRGKDCDELVGWIVDVEKKVDDIIVSQNGPGQQVSPNQGWKCTEDRDGDLNVHKHRGKKERKKA
jgi:hypothetical protein